MDHDRSSDVLNRMNRVRMPTGLEVESAASLPPVTGGTRSEVMRSGLMGKVYALKSRGTELVHHMKHSMSETTHSLQRSVSAKTSDLKRLAVERGSRVKPMIHDTMDKAERELHSNPTKWAGIAAGTSFLLGMIGREMRHRASRRMRRGLPDLIIIETA